jgi:hypothetical protein
MSNTAGVLQEAGNNNLGSALVIWWLLIFIAFYIVFLSFCFVFFRPVPCVLNVASLSMPSSVFIIQSQK